MLDNSGDSGPPCGVPSVRASTTPARIIPASKNRRISFSTRASPTRRATRRIPFDRRLGELADEGEPIVLAEPDADVSRAIFELAEAIAATKREQGVGIVKPLPLVTP
jgi:hypothetical protein